MSNRMWSFLVERNIKGFSNIRKIFSHCHSVIWNYKWYQLKMKDGKLHWRWKEVFYYRIHSFNIGCTYANIFYVDTSAFWNHFSPEIQKVFPHCVGLWESLFKEAVWQGGLWCTFWFIVFNWLSVSSTWVLIISLFLFFYFNLNYLFIFKLLHWLKRTVLKNRSTIKARIRWTKLEPNTRKKFVKTCNTPFLQF